MEQSLGDGVLPNPLKSEFVMVQYNKQKVTS